MWQDTVMSDKDWEVINKEAGVDVIDIVVNLDNRYTPMQQAELIVNRCNLTAKHQAEITGKIMKQAGIREVVEWMREHSDTLSSKTTYRQLQAKLKEWGL